MGFCYFPAQTLQKCYLMTLHIPKHSLKFGLNCFEGTVIHSTPWLQDDEREYNQFPSLPSVTEEDSIKSQCSDAVLSK